MMNREQRTTPSSHRTQARHHAPRLGVIATFLTIVLLVITACSVGDAQQTTPSGVLRWSIEGVSDLTSIDPARPADQQSNTVINLVFAGLVRLDSNLDVQPDGAEDWDISADGRIYTFHIRQDLKFGDGSPVTAHDFLYSINRALAPETASYGAPALLQHIVGAAEVAKGRAPTASGIRVLDDYTLEIELDAPLAYFLAQLTYPHTFVVPRKLIESQGAGWTQRPYGTGPFRVREWRHNEQIILEANPHYWRGTPGVATIRMPFFQNVDVAYDLYRQGNLDIMGGIQSGVPAERIAEVRGLSDLKTTNTIAVGYIGFNNRQAPFDNVAVRRAFALSVDRNVLANQVLAETVIPTERILPPGMPGAQLPITGLSFDPVGARAALGFAGYSSGQALPPITLTYSTVGDNPRVAHALQTFWRDTLGVNVALQGLSLSNFIERLDQTFKQPESGLQMYLSIWNLDYPDPHNFLSQQLRSNSPYNNGHWSNAEFDTLVDRADRLGEQGQHDERLRLYNQAEQIAIEQVGWLPLYNPEIHVLIHPRVQGITLTPLGIIASDWSRVRIANDG